jgi:hypothetical protein
LPYRYVQVLPVVVYVRLPVPGTGCTTVSGIRASIFSTIDRITNSVRSTGTVLVPVLLVRVPVHVFLDLIVYGLRICTVHVVSLDISLCILAQKNIPEALRCYGNIIEKPLLKEVSRIMNIATEETRLLPTVSSGGLDDVEDHEMESRVNKSKRSSTGNDAYSYPKNIFHCLSSNNGFDTNSIVVKVITYSAVSISILLGLLLVVSAMENLKTENTSLISFSSSWWDSNKEYTDSWFHQHDTHNDGDWGHFHKWKKIPLPADCNMSEHDHEHFYSSSYEYDSDGTPNGTKHSYTDRETWTTKNENGTITYYEQWTDNNGTVHTASCTSG